MSGPSRARTEPAVAQSAAATAQAPSVGLGQSLAPRALDALLRLPDQRWVDRLLRGRAWIALIALALMGLVFMQVSMLRMNAGIGQSVERSQTLERQNADLRAAVSQLSSEERIQQAAAEMGMVLPQAGDVQYLRARTTRTDAALAAKVMGPKNPSAATAGAAATTATPAATATAPAVPPTSASQAATQEAQAPVGAQQQQAQTATPAATTAQQPPTQVAAPQQAATAQQQSTPAAAGAAAAPGAGQ